MTILNDQMSTILRSDNHGIIGSNSYFKLNFFNYNTLYESRAKLMDDIIKLKKKSLNPSLQKDNINGISLACYFISKLLTLILSSLILYLINALEIYMLILQITNYIV